jgi:hypothetical protein
MKEHGNKKPTKKKKSKVGPPTKMTSTALALLKEAFLLGCTDDEACLKAEIDPATLYRYQKKNPNYARQKELWKQNPFLIARTTIVREIQVNPDLALKYMERKKKDEFSLKQEVDVTSAGDQIGGFVVVKTEQVKTDTG